MCVPIRNIDNRCCRICGAATPDGHVHILFESHALQFIRSVKWDGALNSMPTEMALGIKTKTNREKTSFIVSGLNARAYIKEWRQVYLSVADMVHHICKARATIYDSLPPHIEHSGL